MEQGDHIRRRSNEPGKKRILALDGGGIRGALTIPLLEELQNILRNKTGNQQLQLYEYFDLIGGTSTGSIIAAALATGMPLEDIKAYYLQLGPKVFSKQRKKWLPNWFNKSLRYFLSADFDESILERELKNKFNFPIGDDKVKTGLCVVSKRADTYSTWPVINHPDAKYYEDNKGISLWKLIRAASAAPTYFKPKKVNVGRNQMGVFIDGGLSSANNPALLLFLVATLKGFPFKWKTGAENLQIISLGTGFKRKKESKLDKIVNRKGIFWGKEAINMFMADANYLNQAIMQYLSNSKTKNEIDREMGDLSDDLLFEAFEYLRYNVALEMNELNTYGFKYTEEEIEDLIEMSNGHNAQKLYDIGVKAVENNLIKEGHFA